MGVFSIFDILAAVFLMLSMMRRLEVKSVQARDYPRVPTSELEAWRTRSMRNYEFTAAVCLAKILLGQLWIAFALPQVPRWLTVLTGLLLDGGWAVALILAWRHLTDAAAERARLGLTVRRPRS